jgi:ABC-type sugar transport system substrate-binding protein
VESAVRPYESLPTSLPASYKPLAHRPAPGGTIIELVNGESIGDLTTGNAMKAAAAAIGWTGKTIVYDGTVQDLNLKYAQAIEEKPTAIIEGGIPSADFRDQEAAAQRAGIITVVNTTADTPNLQTGPDVVNTGPQTFAQAGVINANLMLADAGCKPASALTVTLAFPILDYTVSSFASTVARACPGCKVKTVTLQVADTDTPAATTAIVSALQADPSIKYVFAPTAVAVDGLSAALAAAGISGVKIFGAVPAQQALHGLQAGTNSWWVTLDPTLEGWIETYSVLQFIDNGRKSPVTLNDYPFGVALPSNVSKSASTFPVHPTNYQQLFEQLWKVG